MLLIKNRNNLQPVVYSRRKISERSKDHLIIPAHGHPEALGDDPSNIPGNPTSQPDLTFNSAPKPIPELETGTFETDDLPIALRKGTRACTKYPIAKYISYNHLSETYRAFTTKISELVVPRNIQKHWMNRVGNRQCLRK